MRVTDPITITDAVLTSSTAAEPGTGETPWAAATSYTVGQEALVMGSVHAVYENLIAGVNATSPELAASGATPRWLFKRPSNKYAMFDYKRNTVTSVVGALTTVFTAGVRLDSVGIIKTNAETVTLTITLAGVVVYTITANLRNRFTSGLYDYFFKPLSTRPNIVFYNLPPYSGAVITVTQTKSVGNVECGTLMIGPSYFIGDVQYKAVDDVLNFSLVTRILDKVTFVAVPNVPKTEQTLTLKKEKLNIARTVRTLVGGRPVLWCGIEAQATNPYYDSLLISGFYRRFSINLDNPTGVLVGLELEEV